MRLWSRLILPAMMLLCAVARADLSVSLSYAGPDLVLHPVTEPIEIRFGDAFSLQATVTDSTSPETVATQSWNKVSGPGNVVFSAPVARNTSVSFSEPGTYLLSITATAGTVSQTEELQVTVSRRPTAGRYRGLLSRGEVPAGIVVAKVTSSGAITAVLHVGRQTFRFRPILSVDGTWTRVVSNGVVNVKVTLQTNPAGTVFTATVTSAGLVYRSTLARSGVPTTGVPNAAYRGRHTFLLTTPAGTSDGDARGHGFGVLRVNATGAVSLVGKTPDGLPFSVGSLLRPSGIFDVYAPLLGHTDFIGGALRFVDDKSADTDVSGSLVWRVSNPSVHTLLLDLAGSALQPFPEYLEPWTGSAEAVSAQFSSGGQGRVVVTQSVTLQVGGQGVMGTPATLDLSLRVFKSGLFFGTFRIPGRVSKSDFAGAVLQRTQKGAGLLIGSSTLGWVELEQGGGTPPPNSN